jgi:ABC-type multidrug transport system fused ATPase/permease subunit
MKSISLITPYIRENRSKIIAGLISLIIVDFLQLIIPRIIKWAVDDLTNLQIDLMKLAIYAGYMVVVAQLIGVFRYIWRRCLMGTSRRIEEGLRNRLFSHTQSLSAAYFDQAKTGDLMAHATSDIQQIRMAAGMGMVALNDAIVLGAAAIGFMLYINVRLTVFVLIPMPLIVVGARFFSRKMHRRYQAVQAAFSDLTEVVRERFAGIRIIKAHNRKAEESAKVRDVSQAYIQENIKLVKIIGAFFPMMILLTNLSLAIVLYLGGRQTIMQTITPGDFVAFISYLGLLTWPMMALGWVTNLIQRGRASLDRIQTILEIQPDIRDREDASTASHIRGSIAFVNVSFSYVQPEAAEHEAMQPVAAEHEAMQPVAAEHEAMQPVAAEHEAMQPVAAEHETIQPVNAEHEAMQPVAAEHEAMQPVAAEHEAMQPVAAEHEAMQPVGAPDNIPLSEIHLSINPGSVLGIVGPPGSGKTTLLSLVPRLYDPQKGQILLDDQDIQALKTRDLRSHIAYMPQEPFLFAGTIRENITFGNLSVTDKQLEKASSDAALLETIHNFPKGFDTIVGEKGIILSGGQKQRIALARCLLKKATILILDDPISQVDLETGSSIIDTIENMAGSRTILIASHRISALSFADLIITLDKGRIVESGRHADLVDNDNYYAKIFRLQALEEEMYAF